MPDARDPRRNAAWQAARQWRERARQTRPTGLVGTLKLLLTWLLFGAMMVIAMMIGLVLLLVGWALLPLLRHRMKKRLERMRADQAEDIGAGGHYRESRSAHGEGGARAREQQVLEGDYTVKEEPPEKH